MVNQLPQGWKEEELGNLFDITSSKRVFMADWKRTGVPFYRAREIVKLSENGWVDNELFISEEMYNEYAKKYGIPKENDIMITAVGTLGCVYVVKKNDRFYFKDGNIIWLKNRDIINSQYVKYYFQSPFIKRQIFDNSGAVVGTYTIIKAKQTKIFYPTDKDEQDYIVKTLDAVAEMIKLRKETIQLTKDLIPAIFQEMFGDPITNPKGWEMKTLDNPDICVNCDSERRPITKSDRIKGIYPYYGASGIIDYVDDYIYDGSFLLIAEDGENLRSRSLPIAFSISGKAWVNNHAHVLKFKKHSSQLFIQTLFNNIDISAYITGAAQPKLNQNNLNKIKFPFPPLPLQDEFANKVEQINQNLKIQQEDLDRLEELFDQLLQKAFTGELTRGEDYGKH